MFGRDNNHKEKNNGNKTIYFVVNVSSTFTVELR